MQNLNDKNVLEVYWGGLGEKWLAKEPAVELWRMHNDASVGALLAGWLNNRPAFRLLKTDIFEEGIGEGLYPLLASNAKLLFATDVSLPLLRAAHKRYPNLRLVQCDVLKPTFLAESFDVIVSTSTLDHFQAITELREALGGLSSLLAPGGELLITLDNLANPIIALRNAIPHQLRMRMGLTPYYVGASCRPAQLRHYLTEAGLRVVEMTAVVHFPRMPAMLLGRLLERNNYHRAALRLLAAMQRLEALSRTPTKYITGHYIAARAMKLYSKTHRAMGYKDV